MTQRQGFVTVLLLTLLVLLLCVNILIAANWPLHPQWQYRIISLRDADFEQGMRNAGDQGWDLAFARRAVTGTASSTEGVYECIFKRSRPWFDHSETAPLQIENESAAVTYLRTINTAEVTFLATAKGTYGTIPQLISAGLLDSRFNGTVSGYNFSVTVTGTDYKATAEPASPQAGRYGFFSTADDLRIRYSTTLAPPGQAGKFIE